MSVNKAILVGNVGKDPEIREFDNGNKVANFSLATSETYTNRDGEKVTNTEWHNVAVFGKLADICGQYVKKGSQLYIEGQIKTRSWDDQDGNKRYTTEVVLSGFGSTLRMLGGKAQSEQPQNATQEDVPPAPEEQDLPF